MANDARGPGSPPAKRPARAAARPVPRPPTGEAAEPGDLTTRLQQLEERIRADGDGPARARPRRTRPAAATPSPVVTAGGDVEDLYVKEPPPPPVAPQPDPEPEPTPVEPAAAEISAEPAEASTSVAEPTGKKRRIGKRAATQDSVEPVLPVEPAEPVSPSAPVASAEPAAPAESVEASAPEPPDAEVLLVEPVVEPAEVPPAKAPRKAAKRVPAKAAPPAVPAKQPAKKTARSKVAAAETAALEVPVEVPVEEPTVVDVVPEPPLELPPALPEVEVTPEALKPAGPRKTTAGRPTKPAPVRLPPAPLELTEAGLAPVRPAPRKRPGLAGIDGAATPTRAPQPRSLPELPQVMTSPEEPQRGVDPVVRVALMITVLLLALAAALGSAAVVEHGKTTWKSVAVVRLDGGPEPTTPVEDSIATGVKAVLAETSKASFTRNALTVSGLDASVVRSDITSQQTSKQLISLTTHATTQSAATALAQAASSAFVQLVTADEIATVATPGDRLSATVITASTDTARTAPSRRDAVVYGVAGGLVVLVLGAGLLFALLRRKTARTSS